MFFNPFERPQEILSVDHAHLILGNLRTGISQKTQAEPNYWLSTPVAWSKEIVESAGLEWSDLLRKSSTPRFSVKQFPELTNAIVDNMIYKTASEAHDEYFLEILQCDNSPEYRIYVKYNRILGSRLLLRPTAEFVEKLKAILAQQLVVEASMKQGVATPKNVAPPTKRRTESEEAELLFVQEDRIHLPKEMLTHYGKLKSKIETAGGAYNARGYFEFRPGIDVQEVLLSIQSGKAVNGKKDQQFFATPQELALKVWEATGIQAQQTALEPAPRVMEPSAGDGAIADIAKSQGATVVTVENWRPNVLALQAKGYNVIDRDFLELTPEDIGLFDAIVANPPFTRGLDITHVMHMWKFLKPGKPLSVLMSTTWVEGTQRKQVEFREFLKEHGAQIEHIAAGAFKSSGTNVATVHVVVKKPETVTAPVAEKASADQLELI